MIAHTPYLELAATAIDFELTPAERGALEPHLATCPECRRAAEGFRADARRIAEVPLRSGRRGRPGGGRRPERL